MESNEINVNIIISVLFQFFSKVDAFGEKIQNGTIKNNVHIKEENQKYTDFDWLVQKSFENVFQKYFPSIRILGEEDTSVDINITNDHELLKSMNNIDSTKQFLTNEFKCTIPSNKTVTVFIDPIDATNQLVKNNYEPVTVLIGICVKSKPFIGFIHYPFKTHSHPNNITIFNYPSKGIFSYAESVQKIEFVPDSKWEFVISSSRASPSMIEFIKKFPNYGFNQASGLGNKAVEVILKDNVYFATGVSSVGYWDVCAADCISREIGGGFYDFEGNDIQYEEKREYINKVLFMVSSDTKKKGFIDMVKKHNFYSF